MGSSPKLVRERASGSRVPLDEFGLSVLGIGREDRASTREDCPLTVRLRVGAHAGSGRNSALAEPFSALCSLVNRQSPRKGSMAESKSANSRRFPFASLRTLRSSLPPGPRLFQVLPLLSIKDCASSRVGMVSLDPR